MKTASTAHVRLIQRSVTRTTGSSATARKVDTAIQVRTWLTASTIFTAAAAARTSAITRTIVRVGTSMTIRRWITHRLSTPGAESRQRSQPATAGSPSEPSRIATPPAGAAATPVVSASATGAGRCSRVATTFASRSFPGA